MNMNDVPPENNDTSISLPHIVAVVVRSPRLANAMKCPVMVADSHHFEMKSSTNNKFEAIKLGVVDGDHSISVCLWIKEGKLIDLGRG